MTADPQPRRLARGPRCHWCTEELPHPPKVKPLTRELIAWRARNHTATNSSSSETPA